MARAVISSFKARSKVLPDMKSKIYAFSPATFHVILTINIDQSAVAVSSLCLDA